MRLMLLDAYLGVCLGHLWLESVLLRRVVLLKMLHFGWSLCSLLQWAFLSILKVFLVFLCYKAWVAYVFSCVGGLAKLINCRYWVDILNLQRFLI